VGGFIGTPLDYYLFLKTIEKGHNFGFTCLCHVYHALFIVAFGVFYLVLPLGIYILYCTFVGRLAKRVVHARLATITNPGSALE
jgi:hypothetical protein